MPGWLTSAMPSSPGDIRERAVVVVAIESVFAAFAAVGDVDVGPAVAIEVDDGDRRAHRGDLRHDVVEFGIERGRVMHEVDAGGVGDFFEIKAVASQRGLHVELGFFGLTPRGQRLMKSGEKTKPKKDDGENDSSDRDPVHWRGSLLSAFWKTSGVT